MKHSSTLQTTSMEKNKQKCISADEKKKLLYLPKYYNLQDKRFMPVYTCLTP